MPIDVWGMLQKSQIDPEKIEEAIARLILEHNENEEAHLGAGQSLQSHKASEIIDHAVASIIADKIKDWESIKLSGTFERNDFRWYILFESIDGLRKTTTGTGAITLYPEWVALTTGVGVDSTAKLVKDVFASGIFTWRRRRKIRLSFTIITPSAQTIYFGSGDYVEGENRMFIGFKLVNQALYGVVNDGVSETLLDLGVLVGTGGAYDVEIVHVPNEYTEFFYLGVSKGKIEWELPLVVDHFRKVLCAYIKNTEAANKSVRFNFWDFWQEAL